LSGLEQEQEIVEASPDITVVGLAEQEMEGGCLGGSFTEKLAEQEAEAFFPSLMRAVTV
jgi:hypothetical protein